MTKRRILIVDDEPAHRLMVGLHLKEAGYEILEAGDGQQAVDIVAGKDVDLVLMDIRMPVMDGRMALSRIKENQPDLPVIMMTAYGSIQDAVLALKVGAWDYLTKPLDADEMVIKVGQALNVTALAEQNKTNLARLGERFDFQGLIGHSPAMVAVVDELRMIAPSQATVLILGDSGTGKEVVANIIHHNSVRRDKPFIKVNCAALPDTLLEAELFGHVKGAYTGAVKDRAGRFQAAQGGTIFLDEIGSMPLATQAKLLRTLQEREIEPLGSDRVVKVDVRVLAATNSKLAKDAAEGIFRQDLFYRLNVVSVTLPTLKDRIEDIPLLATFFIDQASQKNERAVTGLTDEALRLLVGYDWPGNVRQLANVIERAVVLCPGHEIDLEQLPPELRNQTDSVARFTPGTTLKDGERAMIEWTLSQNQGNRTRSAQLLGITRKTLQNKIKEYGLEAVGLTDGE